MLPATDREIGKMIGRLIAGEHLSDDESYRAFSLVLDNRVTSLHQGAFLAALSSKGETAAELAGGWRAVYELDTCRLDQADQAAQANLADLDLYDNCGTGNDSFKTFNISTAAALVAAAGGLHLARHGSRAISSPLGTVDLAERLGVDVDCDIHLVAASIRRCGIGLFNGMSPSVHPGALGRILSGISFGSPLNIVASLAHPAMPKSALRGVYHPDLVLPVAETMAAIGYRRALVVFGGIAGSELGMDEASVCGPTSCAELRAGRITTFTLEPEDCGLSCHPAAPLAADGDPELAARRFYRLLTGRGEAARLDAVSLNAGLLFFLAGRTDTIATGVARAAELLHSGAAQATLHHWVACQNRQPERGLAHLDRLTRLAELAAAATGEGDDG